MSEPRHPQPATPVSDSRPRGWSELSRRLLTAAVLVPPVIYVIVEGGLVFLATVMTFLLLGQREFYGLIQDKGAEPHVRLGLVAGVAVAILSYFGQDYYAMVLMTALLLVLMVAQLRQAVITEALASISGTFFGVFYVAWLLSHLIVLRYFYDVLAARNSTAEVQALGLVPESGIFFVLFVLVAVVWCDAGAYFAGRSYGRRKLAPRISPGKTVEGALGGVLVGTLGALLVKGIFDLFWPSLSSAFPWSWALGFGAVVSVMGMIGDLVESLIKRDAAVKDAGHLLPGMGGVLDRIDAPLIASPVMYYMLLVAFTLRIG